MSLFGLVLVCVLNGGISFLNAMGCAWSDAETKAMGGWSRFMWWCCWIMSGLGFGSCYLLAIGSIGIGTGLLDGPNAELFFSTWFVFCAPTFVGVGLAITVDQWARTFREGGWLNWGVSVWDTYAQVHNTLSLINGFGPAFKVLMEGLGKVNKSGKDGWKAVVAILLALFSIGLGFLTTYLIVKKFSAHHALPPEMVEKLNEAKARG